MSRLLALFAIAVLLAGCPSSSSPPPTPPRPDAADAAFSGPPSCATWCDRATALRCPAAEKTPGGASCEDVCKNTQTGPAPFDVACRSGAATCAYADACENPTLAAPGGASDGGAEASPTCAAWCRHADALRCPAAKPTTAGVPCFDVCLNVMSGPSKWDLRCRVSAKTCAAADACERR